MIVACAQYVPHNMDEKQLRRSTHLNSIVWLLIIKHNDDEMETASLNDRHTLIIGHLAQPNAP